MKAIGFNEHYGLQTAVTERWKTMTRRLEKELEHLEGLKDDEFCFIKAFGKTEVQIYDDSTKRPEIIVPRYKIGEVVAIKQSYGDVYDELFGDVAHINNDRALELHMSYILMEAQKDTIKGWTNKMFVKAELMPHHIRITDVKLERLQDIKAYECLKEGIFEKDGMFHYNQYVAFFDPIDAFAELIDRISGEGTWERNPYVFAYSFELID